MKSMFISDFDVELLASKLGLASIPAYIKIFLCPYKGQQWTQK